MKNIQNDTEVFDVSNTRFLKVAEKIRRGEHNFEPIIVYSSNERAQRTIIEDHLRATAFGLAGGV